MRSIMHKALKQNGAVAISYKIVFDDCPLEDYRNKSIAFVEDTERSSLGVFKI